MKRTGRLIQQKFWDNLASTIAMVGSTAIAAIVDRIMVGNLLGGMELAALNLNTPVICVLNIIYAFFIFGGNTLAVTLKAKRDHTGANKCFSISILAGSAVMGLLVLLGILLKTPIVNALCVGKTELFQPVWDYFFPLTVLGICVIFANGTCAFVRVDGLKKIAILIPIVANSVNLLCDFLFMGVMKLGITSAGWATNIGYLVSLLLLIPYFRSKQRSFFFTRLGRGDGQLFLEVMKTGLASALVDAGMLVKSFVMNTIIVLFFGPVGAQVVAVCLSANSIAAIFYNGTTFTMLPIGGALYGEKDYKGLRTGMKMGLYVTELFCLGVVAILMIIPRPFGALFGVSSAEAGPLLDTAFRLFALSLPLVGAQECLRVCLQSTGRRIGASIYSISANTICFVPVLWILASIQPMLLWAAFPVAPILAIAGCLLVLRLSAKGEKRVEGLLFPKEESSSIVYEFSIISSIANAVDAAKEIVSQCLASGMPREQANHFGLATEELCTNIAKYAYGKGEDSVDIFLRIDEKDVVLRIRDNGVIFNPTEFIDDSGKLITGLQLLRNLPGKIEYNRVLGFNNTIVTEQR